LPQQVPALVERALDLGQPVVLFLRGQRAVLHLRAELVLLVDQRADLGQDLMLVHGSAPSRRLRRRRQAQFNTRRRRFDCTVRPPGSRPPGQPERCAASASTSLPYDTGKGPHAGP
jgi:hypothetical protein